MGKSGGIHRSMRKILIIEDDSNLQEGLEFALKSEYEIEKTNFTKKGIQLIRKKTYDAVILDCNLPDGNGYDLCEQVRKFSEVPILMLTARDSEMDEVRALELGMNDFMSKPFSLSVLKARIKKMIKAPDEQNKVYSNGFMIDKNLCKVWKEEEEIPCSVIEYKLLLYLVEHKNKILSKQQILTQIWDSEEKYVDDNVVAVNIRRLREKIEEDSSQPIYIHNVYGMGYLWKEG